MGRYEVRFELEYTGSGHSGVKTTEPDASVLQDWLLRALGTTTNATLAPQKSRSSKHRRVNGELSLTSVNISIWVEFPDDIPRHSGFDRDADSVAAALRNPAGKTLSIDEWVTDRYGDGWTATLSVESVS